MSKILETERLILEPLSDKHKESLFSHFSDEDVMKYMDINTLKNVEQAEKMIEFFEKHIDESEKYRWAIIRKKDCQFLGTCGFNNWIKHRGNRSEIGYDLSKPYWGKGYMKEALEKMIHYGFDTMKLRRIEALVTEGNINSRKLLKKMGFIEEGFLRDYGYWKNQYISAYMYSILKSEWNNK